MAIEPATKITIRNNLDIAIGPQNHEKIKVLSPQYVGYNPWKGL